ncbi:phosphatase PAP2 family protein [Noviherbaspirillum massiliense]|uniref:phosphatase PAP2 family protein n=1 Tax=Noviherbaspirillum massiliense TaxID=1465823 RepID=UPI001FE11326|nr:phosphatase PAP2 family protein [Noviherbaspirillum massiliense]
MTITNLADTFVTVPAAIAIIIWLIAGRAWRMAFWWTLLFSFGLLLVAATKIAFVGWGIGIRSLDFTGISGHAMRASAVVPVLFYLMLQQSSLPKRAAGVVLGLLFGVLVAISRLAIHVHSVSEVMFGFFLGAAISLGFIRIASTSCIPVSRRLIAAGLIALLPTAYANPAPTSRWIDELALYLSGHDKPYVRTAWRMPHSSRTGNL